MFEYPHLINFDFKYTETKLDQKVQPCVIYLCLRQNFHGVSLPNYSSSYDLPQLHISYYLKQAFLRKVEIF